MINITNVTSEYPRTVVLAPDGVQGGKLKVEVRDSEQADALRHGISEIPIERRGMPAIREVVQSLNLQRSDT